MPDQETFFEEFNEFKAAVKNWKANFGRLKQLAGVQGWLWHCGCECVCVYSTLTLGAAL